MKVISVAQFGGPDGLVPEVRPDPVPQPGDALILIEAAGVGFVDVMARQGNYVAFPEPGFVPGLEIAGRVIEVGADADANWVGKRVFGMPMRGGGYADMISLPVEQLALIPDGLTCRDAVALGMNAIVAKIAVARAGVKSGETVFVRGAGGGIGIMAVQFAAAQGAIVSATTSSEIRAARLRALGADHIVDRNVPLKLVSGDVDVVVDTVAGPDLGQQIGRLAANGRYMMCGGVAGAPTPDFGMSLLGIFHRSPTFFTFSLNSLGATDLVREANETFAAAGRGLIKPVVDRDLPMDEAAAAHRALEAREPFGKIILQP